jgi:uncharacterized protein (TIGR02271 family)
LDYTESRSDSGLPAGTGENIDPHDRDLDGVYDDVQDTAVGRDVSGPTTDDAMTRSEEELRVGTAQRGRGRVRLRKYVTTEQRQVTVPVQREEVRVEREPITDANLDAATRGPEISEEEHQVVLHEEEPVVEKRVVPRERVRLDKETVTEQEQVGGRSARSRSRSRGRTRSAATTRLSRSGMGTGPPQQPAAPVPLPTSMKEQNAMAVDNTVARSLHDVGLAAWFGGSLMGAVGLNRVAGAAKQPRQRLQVANKGWAAWTPVNLAGIGAHLAGGAVLLAANKGRLASQPGVGRAAAAKTALTAAALAATAYSRLLGRKLEHASTAPVQDATTPADETPAEVSRPQRQLQALQWIIPALTGAVLVVNARMGEQQRPAQVAGGLLGRLRPGRAA